MQQHKIICYQKVYKKYHSQFDGHVMMIKFAVVFPLLIHLYYDANNIRPPGSLISY